MPKKKTEYLLRGYLINPAKKQDKIGIIPIKALNLNAKIITE